jgi:hypothetical protein
MVYQLWFLTTTYGRISAGLLPSDQNGYIFTSIKFYQGMYISSGIIAIVTLESESDSAGRTEPEGPWSAAGRFD